MISLKETSHFGISQRREPPDSPERSWYRYFRENFRALPETGRTSGTRGPRGRRETERGRGRKRERETSRTEHGCMEPTGRDARAGASVVGGKREFALSHPRIYPTPSSQGAGLRYHPCRPAPRPSVFSPAFFSPIGRPSRRPAGAAPFADRTRVGVRVLERHVVVFYPPRPLARVGRAVPRFAKYA